MNYAKIMELNTKEFMEYFKELTNKNLVVYFSVDLICFMEEQIVIFEGDLMKIGNLAIPFGEKDINFYFEEDFLMITMKEYESKRIQDVYIIKLNQLDKLKNLLNRKLALI